MENLDNRVFSLVIIAIPFALAVLSILADMVSGFILKVKNGERFNTLQSYTYGGNVRKHVDFNTGYVSYNDCALFRRFGHSVPLYWNDERPSIARSM